MTGQRKAANGGNRKAANIKNMPIHFTQSAKRVKLEFIRLAVWLSMAKGV